MSGDCSGCGAKTGHGKGVRLRDVHLRVYAGPYPDLALIASGAKIEDLTLCAACAESLTIERTVADAAHGQEEDSDEA